MIFGVVHNTPVEEHDGFWVKREDLSSPAPGPAFSKYRGVVEHIKNRNERVIGVLDTYHSKAGWAVAYACSQLGRECLNFWPRYKAEQTNVLREAQQHSSDLGARLLALPAGRSSVLYHQARKLLAAHPDSYLMPNALKLRESVEANAAEAFATNTARFRTIILPVSSGTIAAGVIRGVIQKGERPNFVIHMGYSRPVHMVSRYIRGHCGSGLGQLWFIDEEYEYKDRARPGPEAPFPSNPYYDLKSWRWMLRQRAEIEHPCLLWNIGA